MKYDKEVTLDAYNINHPNKFWEFIYRFYQKFNYDIREVDMKFNESERNFRVYFHQEFDTRRGAEIEFKGYEGILTYRLVINDKSQLELTFKRELKFIQDNLFLPR